jgi:hypothetical protein
MTAIFSNVQKLKLHPTKESLIDLQSKGSTQNQKKYQCIGKGSTVCTVVQKLAVV